MKKDHMSAKEYKSLKTEKQIQTEIINYLTAKGYYVQRMNSGVIPQTNKDGTTRRIFLNRRGTPDVMAFIPSPFTNANPKMCYLLFVEVKKPGCRPTMMQIDMMKELEYFGARCIVAHSVEELEELL